MENIDWLILSSVSIVLLGLIGFNIFSFLKEKNKNTNCSIEKMDLFLKARISNIEKCIHSIKKGLLSHADKNRIIELEYLTQKCRVFKGNNREKVFLSNQATIQFNTLIRYLNEESLTHQLIQIINDMNKNEYEYRFYLREANAAILEFNNYINCYPHKFYSKALGLNVYPAIEQNCFEKFENINHSIVRNRDPQVKIAS